MNEPLELIAPGEILLEEFMRRMPSARTGFT